MLYYNNFYYSDFYGILIYLIISFIISYVAFLISYIFGMHEEEFNKKTTYECGFDAFTDARNTFDVHFYLVAILFLIFDLEIVYLFPWASSLSSIFTVYKFSPEIYSMFIFLFILGLGFIYEFKKGALNWE